MDKYIFSKTEHMLIGSRHNINKLTDSSKISVDGKRLNRVTVSESLCVYIEQFRSGDFHSENFTKSLVSTHVYLQPVY